VIFLTFFCNILLVAATWVGVDIPSPDYLAQTEAAYNTVFGYMPRVVAASLAGFLCGELTNAWFMEKIRARTRGRFLWMRTIGSSVIGYVFDTGLFCVIAFAGTVRAFDAVHHAALPPVVSEPAIRQIIHDGIREIDLFRSDPVAVVPVPDLLELFRPQDVCDLLLGKPEIGIELAFIENAADLDIVQLRTRDSFANTCSLKASWKDPYPKRETPMFSEWQAGYIISFPMKAFPRRHRLVSAAGLSAFPPEMSHRQTDWGHLPFSEIPVGFPVSCP
jgi:hypothetical protein